MNCSSFVLAAFITDIKLMVLQLQCQILRKPTCTIVFCLLARLLTSTHSSTRSSSQILQVPSGHSTLRKRSHSACIAIWAFSLILTSAGLTGLATQALNKEKLTLGLWLSGSCGPRGMCGELRHRVPVERNHRQYLQRKLAGVHDRYPHPLENPGEESCRLQHH